MSQNAERLFKSTSRPPPVFGQNAYPYPAKFVPPADPHFQPHRVACGCGRPGFVLDDAVAHLTSSLGHPLAPGAPRRL